MMPPEFTPEDLEIINRVNPFLIELMRGNQDFSIYAAPVEERPEVVRKMLETTKLPEDISKEAKERYIAAAIHHYTNF